MDQAENFVLWRNLVQATAEAFTGGGMPIREPQFGSRTRLDLDAAIKAGQCGEPGDRQKQHPGDRLPARWSSWNGEHQQRTATVKLHRPSTRRAKVANQVIEPQHGQPACQCTGESGTPLVIQQRISKEDSDPADGRRPELGHCVAPLCNRKSCLFLLLRPQVYQIRLAD